METIRPTYEETCPDCKYIDDSEAIMCEKHWDELQYRIAGIHSDGDKDVQEALYRLMVEKDDEGELARDKE